MIAIKPCTNTICKANIKGDCGKPSEIPDDFVCELGQADKMIPHYHVKAVIPGNHLYFYAHRKGFITLQTGELVYKP